MPRLFLVVLLGNLCVAVSRNNLTRTPPMGWMSWEIFRCETDCKEHPTTCISEDLYKSQVDGLVENGFLDVGYTGIHMDDCWEQKSPKRDPDTNELVPDKARFPSGLSSLGSYIHSKGGTFGLYTAESSSTCGGFPASANHEIIDAKTFATWGVDYLKVDGCGPASYYPEGYKAMGAALEGSGRQIVYSCSWPAYIGANESTKPFQTFIDDGCNLWRNFADIQCNWGSLSGIIDHFGSYSKFLQQWAAPGHWHDMDMLIIGNGCVSIAEERTQMAIWSLLASPLIMGNDLRSVPSASRAILTNRDAIAINQDPLGRMGVRLEDSDEEAQQKQTFVRQLQNGDVAVGLYNKGGAKPPPIPEGPCPESSWNHTQGGYYEACGGAAGNLGVFSGLSAQQAQHACCNNRECVGFSFSIGGAEGKGSGYYKRNAGCGLTKAAGYDGYTRISQIPVPSSNNTADLSIRFADMGVGWGADTSAQVLDVWSGEKLGVHKGSFTAKSVGFHDTAFLRLTKI